MIKPGEITDDSFVITVIAFADFHGGDLCQAHFQVPPKSVLMQRLTTSLHMALNDRKKMVLKNTHVNQMHVHVWCSHQDLL